MEKINFAKFSVGDFAKIEKKMTDKLALDFAKISEDFNPIHFNEEYAIKNRFRGKIIHGMVATSLFSGLFSSKIPGPGCVYKTQTIRFKRPIYINELVTAKVEIKKILEDKKIIHFSTCCIVKEKIVVDGMAEIFIP